MTTFSASPTKTGEKFMHKIRISPMETHGTSHRAELIKEVLEAVREVRETKMLQTVCQHEGYTYVLNTVFKEIHLGLGKIPQPGLRALCELVRTECEQKAIFELVVEVQDADQRKEGLHFSMNMMSSTHVVFFISKH